MWGWWRQHPNQCYSGTMAVLLRLVVFYTIKKTYFNLNHQYSRLQILQRSHLNNPYHQHTYFIINTTKNFITKTSANYLIYTIMYYHINSTFDIFNDAFAIPGTNFTSNLQFNFFIIITFNLTTKITNNQYFHVQFRLWNIPLSESSSLQFLNLSEVPIKETYSNFNRQACNI